MYRAIVGSIGDTPNAALKELRLELVKQFRFSPLCANLYIQKDPIILDTNFADQIGGKVEYYESNKNIFGQKPVFAIIPNSNGLMQNELAARRMDSIAFLSSIYMNRATPDLSEIVKTLRVSSPDARITSFNIGRLIRSESDNKNTYSCPRSRTEILCDSIYPIYSQFVPSRYREITPKDLALAIRMNYETCQIVNGNNGAEELNYVDCMKIIGLDDKI